MLKAKAYLILGVGTDIGKTFFLEEICKNLRQKKTALEAIKPIMSGFGDDDKNSDSAKIITALGKKLSKENLDEITPWRFEQPISPHFAGKINFSEVKKFCSKKIAQAKKTKQLLFIEGAGGVMTPINDKKTFLDLAAELEIPILLLTANYLGAISHTLCAVAALKSRKISIENIIFNEGLPTSRKSSLVNDSEVMQTIENFTKIKTISLRKFCQKAS